MVHSHTHLHDGAAHAHGAAGAHRHAPELPHPAQAATLSLLRMTVAQRLGLAILLSAALWGLVWLAMRPA